MSSPRSSAGVTLLATMVALALMIVALAVLLTGWAQERALEKQTELLWTGEKFREAIGRYYERSPDAEKRYPERLEDLLEDPRYPGTQRYLRKIYRDPITGKAAWGIVAAPSGGIMGVYSLSTAAPIRGARKTAAKQLDAGAEHYADWKFVYAPPDAPPDGPRVGGTKQE